MGKHPSAHRGLSIAFVIVLAVLASAACDDSKPMQGGVLAGGTGAAPIAGSGATGAAPLLPESGRSAPSGAAGVSGVPSAPSAGRSGAAGNPGAMAAAGQRSESGAGAGGTGGAPVDDADAGVSDPTEAVWVTTWGTTLIAADLISGLESFNRVTLRQVVHTSVGGQRVRVRFSNVFGTTPLEIGAAHVARRTTGSAIDPASDRPLTFKGAPSVAIPTGQQVTSDPIEFEVPAFADLAISIDLPESTQGQSVHAFAAQTSYVSRTGGVASAPTLEGAREIVQWFFLDGVDVERAAPASTLVAFGASNVDGFASTADANQRWPDHLARRLAAASRAMGVANEGYSGNAILDANVGESAIDRFERDVSSNSGVTHVLLMEGQNDLLVFQPTPEALIGGVRTLAQKAKAAGIRFIAGTLTPYEGLEVLGGLLGHTPEGEATRTALNDWIRTTDELDGFVDFDQVLRDPAAPTKLLPAYDSGDHIHPNDAGYKAMADAIDLSLLQ